MVLTKPDASTLHLWLNPGVHIPHDKDKLKAECKSVHVFASEEDLRPASEVQLDGREWEDLDEWLKHSDVCTTCEDQVRAHLGLEPRPLTAISGVGRNKADALRRAGYRHRPDIRPASQEDLADVEGIGNALAARIKADVGYMPGEGEP